MNGKEIDFFLFEFFVEEELVDVEGFFFILFIIFFIYLDRF